MVAEDALDDAREEVGLDELVFGGSRIGDDEEQFLRCAFVFEIAFKCSRAIKPRFRRTLGGAGDEEQR